jgi:hypothetical protein
MQFFFFSHFTIKSKLLHEIYTKEKEPGASLLFWGNRKWQPGSHIGRVHQCVVKIILFYQILSSGLVRSRNSIEKYGFLCYIKTNIMAVERDTPSGGVPVLRFEDVTFGYTETRFLLKEANFVYVKV